MKTTIFFSLAFILCIFKANSAPDPVLDDLGKPLRSGVQYYVILTNIKNYTSTIWPAAVGNNNTCPAGVVEHQTKGWVNAFTIAPVDPKKGVIRLYTDVNIKFLGSTLCDESNVWKLKYDKDMKQYAVMMGGVEGNPGPETLDNWFKIEKTTDGYKFVYCPSVCSYCKVMCGDIGTTIDNNGVSRLVLGGDPIYFNFYI
ncbi:putative proteinase inhibitor I3, Kunitz legume, kunitz inhibitor STI-like superfamily [Helianthus annuus]|uniref:Proteinase inhibitor I3 n=1 Tax=Helianthus annuus TaxID=4232 RepID=A0A251RPI2_HELAN|nr:miraculin [Helianthus annuus]KAF5755387.1 putative proteinase inhibitor I3, Kunitz legume, kunitz inhibitor STI-like superfamily [Helianthus annuus]KAJ0429114.1 putative proteinase inhibitor I3, Kunitz legume, kunitz inhibitor STI-like superfamily [Helianthus annuus]KAJ0447471.1 putative proteinase inhibitor I3, Kunitz legume, kunitz inhibitor STI-like superfamily [Helianthus annuus]KAJ0632361.1 putative proteinase inhibitor I3, Kunitz legume, kunitz inhibitor STI-like superfamily [Helianthu